MYIMFSTPLTCCSTGAATVSATTSALAPGYDADTSTVGGVISGYCVTGRVKTAMAPAIVMTMDSTDAKIGRLMKKLENTEPLVCPAAGAPRQYLAISPPGRAAPSFFVMS